MIVLTNNGSIVAEISRETFLYLVNDSKIIDNNPIKKILSANKVSWSELKNISLNYNILLPLFFASIATIKTLIITREKHRLDKISKRQALSFRGDVPILMVSKIVDSLSRKQTFLNKFTNKNSNSFIGCYKSCKDNTTEGYASLIKNYFSIDINHLRALKNKSEARDYLIDMLAEKNIYVSLASNSPGIMAQKLRVRTSGFIVTDSISPYIFINSIEDDEKLSEPVGRQIFTIVLLTTYLCFNLIEHIRVDEALNSRFVSKRDKNFFHEIVGKILIEASDSDLDFVLNLDNIDKVSNKFKITPGFLLYHLLVQKKISLPLYNKLKSEFLAKKNENKIKRAGKYSYYKQLVRHNNKSLVLNVFDKYDNKTIGWRDGSRVIFQRNLSNKKEFNDKIAKIRLLLK